MTGRAGIFTGGLDLSTLSAGGDPADRLLAGKSALLLGVLERAGFSADDLSTVAEANRQR